MNDLVLPTNPVLNVAWDKRLLVDVAIGTPEDAILNAYDMTVHHFRAILADPGFQTALSTFKKDLQQDGMSFKLKAQLQAEAMLEENWVLAHDRETVPAETRRKAIADTVRWAGFDNSGGQSGPGGGGFTINIDLSNARQGVTIEGGKP